MCRTRPTYSSLQPSNTLNYRHIELASLCTVPLSTIDGLSRLTELTASKGQAEFESNLEASQVPTNTYCVLISVPLIIVILK